MWHRIPDLNPVILMKPGANSGHSRPSANQMNQENKNIGLALTEKHSYDKLTRVVFSS